MEKPGPFYNRKNALFSSSLRLTTCLFIYENIFNDLIVPLDRTSRRLAADYCYSRQKSYAQYETYDTRYYKQAVGTHAF